MGNDEIRQVPCAGRQPGSALLQEPRGTRVFCAAAACCRKASTSSKTSTRHATYSASPSAGPPRRGQPLAKARRCQTSHQRVSGKQLALVARQCSRARVCVCATHRECIRSADVLGFDDDTHRGPRL